MITWSKAKAKKKALAAVAMALSLLGPTTAFTAPANPLVTSKGKGMVVSSQALADRIGQDVLDRGGNAVDAAVAVGYALAVCHPNAGNIGGGGFAVIHTKDGEDIALDFRETAPGKATKDMYLDEKGNVDSNKSRLGYLSVGVPGTVAGMTEMLNKYGTKSLKELMGPSIEMAEKRICRFPEYGRNPERCWDGTLHALQSLPQLFSPQGRQSLSRRRNLCPKGPGKSPAPHCR